MHRGAEGSESAMALEGVICAHVRRVLATGLSRILRPLSLCRGALVRLRMTGVSGRELFPGECRSVQRQ